MEPENLNEQEQEQTAAELPAATEAINEPEATVTEEATASEGQVFGEAHEQNG